MLSWIRHIFHSASGAEHWQQSWDARVQALEGILGKCDGTVYHAPPPLHMEGYSDVLRFRNFNSGVTYATCDLIGSRRQVPNTSGNYELMMCCREESAWAPAILSRLAKYTFDAAVHIGDTMELVHAVPSGSNLVALLFAAPDVPSPTFEVQGRPASIVLCLGITSGEFSACKSHSSQVVLRMLKEKGVFPFTDLLRPPVTG
jgi:hypothetical protein